MTFRGNTGRSSGVRSKATHVPMAGSKGRPAACQRRRTSCLGISELRVPNHRDRDRAARRGELFWFLAP